jgi:hypothetical protein
MAKQCTHSRRAGIVTNQPDGYDPNRAHASRTVCGRQECIDAAKSYVAGFTNEHAVFIPDSDRTARL